MKKEKRKMSLFLSDIIVSMIKSNAHHYSLFERSGVYENVKMFYFGKERRMKKRMKEVCLLAVVLFIFAGQSFALLQYDSFLATGPDGLYTTGSNWNTGTAPDNRDGNPELSARIKNNTGAGHSPCLVTDGMDLSVYKVRIGDGSVNANMTMSGGVLAVTSTENLNDFCVGWVSRGAVFEMTDGTVNVDGQLKINQGLQNSVQVRLYGGVFNAQSYFFRGNNFNCYIDITEGKLVLQGDHKAQADADIDLGKIIGYGGDKPAMAVYDDVADVTTVYAVPEPATMILLGFGGLALLRRK